MAPTCIRTGLLLMLLAALSLSVRATTTMSYPTSTDSMTEAVTDPITTAQPAGGSDITTASVDVNPTQASDNMTASADSGVTDVDPNDDTTDDGADSTDAPGATDDPDATDATDAPDDEDDDETATDEPSTVSDEPDDDNDTATDEPDSVEMTDMPEDSIITSSDGDGDDDTTDADMATSRNEDSTGRMTAEPGTKPDVTTSTILMCYECSGSDCESARTNDHLKCTGTLGICFMTFDLSNGTTPEVTRSCNSTVEHKTSCGSNYPSGSYATGKCEYCCNTDKCNGGALTATTCEAIRDSGARGRHGDPAVVCLVGLLVAVSWTAQRLLG